MSETNLYYVIENVLSYSNLLLLKSLMCFYFFQAVDKKVSYKYWFKILASLPSFLNQFLLFEDKYMLSWMCVCVHVKILGKIIIF